MPGTLVTETFAYDGDRQVTAWVPEARPEAIVYAADGQITAPWGAAVAAAAVTAPPTLIVGVHRTADETQRLHEYSPGFDPARFAAHEAFFTETVRAWAEQRFALDLPRERTAIYGVSAGAELALALALRHPTLYGTILAASPGGGYRPGGPLPTPLPRAYLIGGTEEPWFLENATRWADALQGAGAEVAMHARPGAHGGPFWKEELPLMVAWAFGG
jgi:enterochelin esterase-like enzyme